MKMKLDRCPLEKSKPILISKVVTSQGGFYIFYDCKKEYSYDTKDYNERECTNDTRSGISLIEEGFSKWEPPFINKLYNKLGLKSLQEFNEYLKKTVFNNETLQFEHKLRWVD